MTDPQQPQPGGDEFRQKLEQLLSDVALENNRKGYDSEYRTTVGFVLEHIVNILADFIAADRTALLHKLRASLPKRVPDKYFARNREDSPWSLGWNDAIGECYKTIDRELADSGEGEAITNRKGEIG